jgi:hypothetical protein
MDEYEESNATIQGRYPKLFKDDTYEFEASKELVICMPFDFIDGLKDKKWTHDISRLERYSTNILLVCQTKVRC